MIVEPDLFVADIFRKIVEILLVVCDAIYTEEKWTVTKIYNESGISGKSTRNRPMFQKMMDDIENDMIDIVISTELSRLFRSTLDSLHFLDYIKKYDVNLIILRQSFDTTTPYGKAFFTMASAMAEFERDLVSERVTENLLSRAQRGLFNGGPIPWGLKSLGDGKLEIDDETAFLVRTVFDLYLELGSSIPVAKEMNERGHRVVRINKEGEYSKPTKFNKKFVERVIRNKTYAGIIEINLKNKDKDQSKLSDKDKYQTVDSCWPAVVDELTFQKAQRMMDRNVRRHRNSQVQEKHTFILTRKLICKKCNSIYENTSSTSRNGVRHFYYKKPVECKCYPNLKESIPANDIEVFVLKRLTSLADDHALITDIIEDSNKGNSSISLQRQQEAKILKKEQQSLTNDINTLLLRTDIAPEMFKKFAAPQINEKNTRLEQIESRLQEIEMNELDELYDTDELIMLLRKPAEIMKQLKPMDQIELVNLLIENITISDKEVNISIYTTKPQLKAPKEKGTHSVCVPCDYWLPELDVFEKLSIFVQQRPFFNIFSEHIHNLTYCIFTAYIDSLKNVNN